tara:strand:- start:2909 stop:3484 length:576 start_codon:yes stop_codon:yes gene_type:complete
MFQSLINASLNLLLFRGGPQDLPYHPPLTGVLVPAAVLVNFWVVAQVFPAVIAAVMSLATVVAMAYVTRIMLRMRKSPERFSQTYHSLLMVALLTGVLSWIPLSQMPQIESIEQVAEGEQARGPLWVAMLVYLINFWKFAVNASIFRQAGQLSLFVSILVSVLMEIGIGVFTVFFFLVASALFGTGAAPAG